MQIQLNTDNVLTGSEELSARVESELQQSLSRFADRLTRIEVHLNDSNSAEKSGDDKRCMLEARVRGQQPTSVTHHAPTVELALSGATDKLVRALDRVFGKLDAGRRGDPRAATGIGGDETI